MWATTHSSAAFVWTFERVSRCPLFTEVEMGINAPWALIARVWVSSSKGDARAVWPETRTGIYHQDALAPAAVGGEPGGFAGLGKPCIQSREVFLLNAGKHETHALARLGVDDSCEGCRRLRAVCDAFVGASFRREGAVGVHLTA